MYYVTVKDFLFGTQVAQMTSQELKNLIDDIEAGKSTVINGKVIEHGNIEAVRFVTPKFNHIQKETPTI